MELHDKFLYPNMRETIFGFAPEYSDKFDLAIFLRRIVILSSAFARVYYKANRNSHENMTSRVMDRIVDRPYISLDNAVSVLTTIQKSGEDMDRLGLSALKILSDETSEKFIDLYEVKAILQDETGKFFNAATCMSILDKVVNCVNFITELDITCDADAPEFVFRGVSYDIGDLFKYEFCYLYRALQDVDPLTTTYLPL